MIPIKHLFSTLFVFVIGTMAIRADQDLPLETQTNISVIRFEQRIADVESEHGALDYRLAEHFLSLGLTHRANDDPTSAAVAFGQALHINRVNKGLHHLLHIPIVDLVIESYSQLGDWQAVEQHHRFRYWVHRRELDRNSDEYVDACLIFANWETRSYKLDTDVRPIRALRDALDALDAAYQVASENPSSDESRMVTILNAQADANLNLALHMVNSREDPITGGPVGGDDFGDIIERRNIILASFIRGGEALKRVITLSETRGEQIQHGLAIANLADWELLFDRPQSSAKNYRRAYGLLKAAGLTDDEMLAEFGSPRQMSRFSVKRRTAKPSSPANGDAAYVIASFDVTKTGQVRKLKVVTANSARDARLLRQTRETLRTARFRPRIEVNGPVRESTTIRYIVRNKLI